MPRPQTYQRDDVVESAKRAFWARGFDGTAITDLEEATGLSRSSIYAGFGTKRGLFDVALDQYSESFIIPLLSPMEREGAGSNEIAAFFLNVKGVLLRDPVSGQRGCLMVNSVAEMAGRQNGDTESRGVAYRDRLRGAFWNALKGTASSGEIEPSAVGQWAALLGAATFGVWLTARLDPVDAAGVCDQIVAEVRSWRSGPSGK
ncbi:MAG TPA: TetR/AcrR family transcriptional regulator [Actinomycetota bacterium]